MLHKQESESVIRGTVEVEVTASNGIVVRSVTSVNRSDDAISLLSRTDRIISSWKDNMLQISLIVIQIVCIVIGFIGDIWRPTTPKFLKTLKIICSMTMHFKIIVSG